MPKDKLYYFDILTGKCFNSEGEVARGDSSSLECALHNEVESRNDEFARYNFFGADARGVSVEHATVSIYDLVVTLSEIFKYKKFSFVKSKYKPIARRRLNLSILKKTGFKEKYTLKDGLVNTVNWFLKNYKILRK